ncbi:MAG TPA: helix-turn-helix domain-containing protein [Chloroflexota bacterium]|jgi:transcriptional regulator with XRE-family HTH domain
MGSEVPNAFPPWESSRPAIAPCTRLYHLPPIGVGTGWTESLTSYVARLADAHCLRVSSLIAREIAPLVAERGGVRALTQQNNWGHYSHAINGTAATARTLVDVVQVLSGQQHLHVLTMLTWRQVLPAMGLLRRERVWCPVCYQEWREHGLPLYDPLLWSLRAVTVCLRHGDTFCTHCPACQKVQAPLALAARPGHCASCHQWLGRTSGASSGTATETTPSSLWASWAAEAVAELIAAMPFVSPPTRENLRRAIDQYSTGSSGAGRMAVAQAAHISHAHLWSWRRGRTVPSLPLLLRLCSSLGMTPLHVLAPGVAGPDQVAITATRGTPPAKRPRTPRNGDDHATIRQRVDAFVCQNGIPPPPLRRVAQATGHTEGTLRRICPDLCAGIVASWRTNRHAQKLQREQALAAAVRQGMRQLHAQGLPLTTNGVGAFLPSRAYLRSTVARQAWRETLVELGLAPEPDGCATVTPR